jgi:hypothetical protein
MNRAAHASNPAMRPAWWVSGLLCIASVIACAATSDYTPQIHVTPGAAARVLWIESHRPHAAPSAREGAPAAAVEGGQEAEVEGTLDEHDADGDQPGIF